MNGMQIAFAPIHSLKMQKYSINYKIKISLSITNKRLARNRESRRLHGWLTELDVVNAFMIGVCNEWLFAYLLLRCHNKILLYVVKCRRNLDKGRDHPNISYKTYQLQIILAGTKFFES